MTGLSKTKDDTLAGPGGRREFLIATNVAMGCGLAASYGTFGVHAIRYLYPNRPREKVWMFVTQLSRFDRGDSIDFEDPSGAKIVIARHASTGKAEDFVALSSVCPHLGCQVHWQAKQEIFFCPCHNGAFDAQGKAIQGPPAAGVRPAWWRLPDPPSVSSAMKRKRPASWLIGPAAPTPRRALDVTTATRPRPASPTPSSTRAK